MFAEIVKSLIEILKLAPRYLAAIALIAGALILLPPDILAMLGLEEFSTEYRMWLGLSLLVSLGICLVSVVLWLYQSILDVLNRRSIRSFIVKKLNRLTEDEKQILRYYFAKETRSNTLKLDDGVVQELVRCRIIYRSARLGNLVQGFSHNINDLAWDYIHANPHVLEGSTNTYRTDKRSYW